MAQTLPQPVPLQASALDSLAALNKAASDPLRLEVLRVLHRNSYGVLELSHILDTKQSALSHHLKVLAQAALVDTRREGNSIFYRRHSRPPEDTLYALQQALFQAIDQQSLPNTTKARIQQIQKERSANSRGFFQQQSEAFEQQQERIATHAIYGRAVLDLLRHSGGCQTDCALEIGPGNGEFLAELSPLFRQVIALDNSGEMLARARQQCALGKFNNIRFVHGDTEHALQEKVQANCIVLNMVLHHIPAPAEIFADLFRLTMDHGILLITELCRHQQDWVQQACGDLWQGFEPEELIQWGQDAGFSSQQSVYHALRNGFQIQLHSFRKTPLPH